MRLVVSNGLIVTPSGIVRGGLDRRGRRHLPLGQRLQPADGRRIDRRRRQARHSGPHRSTRSRRRGPGDRDHGPHQKLLGVGEPRRRAQGHHDDPQLPGRLADTDARSARSDARSADRVGGGGLLHGFHAPRDHADRGASRRAGRARDPGRGRVQALLHGVQAGQGRDRRPDLDRVRRRRHAVRELQPARPSFSATEPAYSG